MSRPRFVGIRPMVRFLVMALFAILFTFGMGWVIVALWNVLMPVIFALPKITYWQALGLFVLARILFGRFGGGGGWRNRMRRSRFVHGWKDLTPEERDRFRNAMGSCGPANFGEGATTEKA